MAEPFIAEIRIFAGNFAPRGWSFCNGNILPIAQNTALFSLVGTTYGGNGRTDFGLPNLQARAPVHAGRGPGLTDRAWGQTGGAPAVTLNVQTMPSHPHTLNASNQAGDSQAPSNARTLARANGPLYQNNTTDNLVNMAPQALANAGGNGPHNNLQPYLAMYFIIAMVGIYPSRS